MFGWLSMLGLLITGAPLFVALGLGSALMMIFQFNTPPTSIMQIMVGQVSGWPLLAMPLFILAGGIMVGGGTAKRLIDLFNAFVGHHSGGLIFGVVAFCALFGAISGSGYAAIAAVGTMMFPELRKYGYSDKLSTGVVAITGELGLLIPPSILFIVLAMLMQVSSASLFAAGLIPGFMLALIFGILGVFIAKREGVIPAPRASWKTRGRVTIKASPALIMPIIILGGIYSGFFTPTEAAAVSCGYGILIGALVYRELTWKKLWDSFMSTAQTSGIMYMMIASLGLFNYVISRSGIGVAITNLILGANLNSFWFVFVFSIAFVVLGFFMEAWTIMYIAVPLLLPAFAALNLSLVWFGVLFCVGTMIGQMTPPMCLVVYFTSKVAKVPPDVVVKGVAPFVIAETVFLIVLTLIPELSLWLPRVLGLSLG